MTAHKHAKLIADYAADAAETDKPWERWEFKGGDVWKRLYRTPNWHELTEYRRKPQKKAVDLSVLIRSGIDCEFNGAEGGWLRLGEIHEITDSICAYTDNSGNSWMRCRPRMNHWHSWQGGECPLPEGVKVAVITRGDEPIQSFNGVAFSDVEVNELYWSREKKWRDGDIIAFKVTGLAGGYCWPWELEQ